MALINCGESYTQDISGCVDYITFALSNITTEDSYIIKFTYPSGAMIQQDVVLNTSYGYQAINEFDVENNNLWNIGSGPVLVEVFKVNGCNAEVFTICENEYTSLTLNFTNLIQGEDYAVVPCDCN